MYVETSFIILGLVAILFFIAYMLPKEERDLVTLSASLIILIFGLVLSFNPLEVKTGETSYVDNTSDPNQSFTNTDYVYDSINNGLNIIISLVLIILGLAGVVGSAKNVNENRWRRREL